MDKNQANQLAAIEAMKKQLMSKILDKEAFERLGRIRSVNHELAGQCEIYLIQAYQAGKLKTPVTDSDLKEILKALSEKKNIKIKRK